MEDAVKDKYFMRKQNWKLEVINNCRRYLGVYYISKLMDGSGNVNRDYLNGTAKVYDSHNTEAMRKPPKQAWTEWKCFIFRNYLIKGYQVHPPIGALIVRDNSTKKSEREIMGQLDSDVSLKSLIAKLPQSIGILLQNIQLPSNNREALYEKMIDGTLVGASDGSLKQ